MATKFVLIKLADNANDEGFCWPALDHVATQCECDKSTVRRHIKKLEELGLVHVQHRTQDNATLSNYYHLNIPVDDREGGGSTQPPGGAHSHPRGVQTATRGMAHSHPGGGRQRPGGVAHSHPNHHIEPSLNQSLNLRALRGGTEPPGAAHSHPYEKKPDTQIEKKRMQLILHNLGERFKPKEGS